MISSHLKSFPLQVIFILLCTTYMVRLTHACSTGDVQSQMQLFYKKAVSSSLRDSGLQAGLLRAGFHDCISTTTEKPDSGCNGSLRSEKERMARNNARLGPTIDFVVNTRDSLATCISYADAFVLGYCAAVKTAAGLSIVTLMVNPSFPRTDVPDGVDDLTSDGRVLLPNPTVGFDTNLQFYAERGLTATDLVVSNVVGHAIGSFRNRVDGSEFPLNNFTATPNVVGPQYAAHLLWRHENSDDTDLKGFATLRSDLSFVASSTGRDILSKYASFKLIGGNQNSKIRMSWTGAQKKKVLADFQRFSVKMGQVSGKVMTGQASIKDPDYVDDLKRSTKDWDGPRDEFETGSKQDIDQNPQLSDTPDDEKPWFKVSKNFFSTVYSKVE